MASVFCLLGVPLGRTSHVVGGPMVISLQVYLPYLLMYIKEKKKLLYLLFLKTIFCSNKYKEQKKYKKHDWLSF